MEAYAWKFPGSKLDVMCHHGKIIIKVFGNNIKLTVAEVLLSVCRSSWYSSHVANQS